MYYLKRTLGNSSFSSLAGGEVPASRLLSCSCSDKQDIQPAATVKGPRVPLRRAARSVYPPAGFRAKPNRSKVIKLLKKNSPSSDGSAERRFPCPGGTYQLGAVAVGWRGSLGQSVPPPGIRIFHTLEEQNQGRRLRGGGDAGGLGLRVLTSFGEGRLLPLFSAARLLPLGSAFRLICKPDGKTRQAKPTFPGAGGADDSPLASRRPRLHCPCRTPPPCSPSASPACGCRCSGVSACPAAPGRPAHSRLVPSGKATSVSAR